MSEDIVITSQADNKPEKINLARDEAIAILRSEATYLDAPPSVRAWIDALIEHGEGGNSSQETQEVIPREEKQRQEREDKERRDQEEQDRIVRENETIARSIREQVGQAASELVEPKALSRTPRRKT